MSDAMVRLNAALSDRYRIERELGAGGMATVYLAADLKHDRKVAIKVLKPELAAVLGAERFVQEIKTTAALSHPHILPLFDSGEAGGFLYYVMPYIKGETIRDRLNRETQLGIDEAVKIATEVADALDYAHRNGVIHRDIKPENILLHDGRPMVMDFGIALAVSAAAGGRMTETGLSLGTPHYMSPEQATADKAITARSDVYSLASVLYEMLAGEPPHMGNSAQQIIMKIITERAQPVTELRNSVPPNVAAALAKALEKLPADRFDSAQAFAGALANPGFMTAATTAAMAAPVSARGWVRNPLSLGAVGVAVAAILVAVWALFRPSTPAQVTRLAVPLAPGEGLTTTRNFDLSRDGSVLVYVGPTSEGQPRLWIRRLAELESTPLAGTDGATIVSLSPDGGEVAFAGAQVGDLKILPLSGGPARPLRSSNPQNVFWGPEGNVYASARVSGIARLPAAGGQAEPLAPDQTRYYYVTDVLPDGRTAVVTFPFPPVEIQLLDLASHQLRPLTAGSDARFIEPGYLVFLMEDGTTLAGARFEDGELHGPVVPLVQDVDRFRVSDTGTLVYSSRRAGGAEFVWVDRSGSAVPAAPGWIVNGIVSRGFSLSPDERRVVLSMFSRESGGARAAAALWSEGDDLWVKEIPDGGLLRLTRDAAQSWGPRWSSSDRITYSVGSTGSRAIVSRRADGTGTADTVFGGSLDAPDAQFSPDSQWLVLRIGLEAGRYRQVVARHRGSEPDSGFLISGDGNDAVQPALSPDGRLLAYSSNESGTFEVYVRPFPDVGSGRIVVSTSGGLQPKWSPSGQELFFVSGEGEMMVARISSTPSLVVSERQRLFAIPATYFGMRTTWATNYEVSANGQRFLMYRAVVDPETSRGPDLIVVQNWIEELKRALGR